jgi:stage III sporulation protein AH
MKKFKRNAVVLTVLLFVCAAVYLNWAYNKNESEAAASKAEVGAEVSQILGNEAETVGDDTETSPSPSAEDDVDSANAEQTESTDQPEDGETEDTGLYYNGSESVSVNSDYFDSVRLTRSQARDEAVATLSQVSESDAASQETIDEAMASISQIADYSLLEAQVESLIMAKGFEECVVYISEDGISVAVPAPSGGLSAAEVARITDVVTTETSFTAEDLKIIEVK